MTSTCPSNGRAIARVRQVGIEYTMRLFCVEYFVLNKILVVYITIELFAWLIISNTNICTACLHMVLKFHSPPKGTYASEFWV